MGKVDGTVRVVLQFATGYGFVGLYATIHYGAPRSLEDYFQESGRAGRNCTSTRVTCCERMGVPVEGICCSSTLTKVWLVWRVTVV